MQSGIKFMSRAALIFGEGEAANIGNILNEKKMNRVMIFTDKGIIEAGIIKKIKSSLSEYNLQYYIYANIKTNPLKTVVEEGLKITGEFKPDVIIAVGGGSVLDTAKAVAVYYGNSDMGILQEQGELKGSYNRFPVITIPTTAGTGSEVTSWAVITDPEIPEKISIGGYCMAPFLAIIDPEMTLTLPPKLTLWTGMDAFIHALEAYISRNTNEYVDRIAYLAMDYIVHNLPVVIADGSNLQARGKMILGSYLAGWAMENVGLGLVHGMSHQVGAFYHHHHGLLNAILLPYVIEYNYPECEEKMNNVNKLFGPVSTNLTESIFAFYKSLDLTTKISIKNSDIHTMSEMAINNVNSQSNPRTPELEDVKKIYCRAFKVEE